MKESEKRREAIIKRLLCLDHSTRKELDDLIEMTALICEVPTVVISLLDTEKQHILFSKSFDKVSTDLADSICRFTILQNDILEIPDIKLDERFANRKLETGTGCIRYYAGAPLQMQSGEAVGSLCIIDTKPNALTGSQRKSLTILARQATTILEFANSLAALKEETGKMQNSEMKLKAIFQSSPDPYFLVDENYKIKAFNNAASVLASQHSSEPLKEGDDMLFFVKEQNLADFKSTVCRALNGEIITTNVQVGDSNIWWQIKHHPVYNHDSKIVGVSIDISDITDMLRSKENIMAQNLALKKIAQVQSHELRRPVANILELTGLLKNKGDENFDLHFSYLEEEAINLEKTIRKIAEINDNKLLQDRPDEVFHQKNNSD